MQLVPVEAIGVAVAVSRPISAEAMQRVLVQSEIMAAKVADATDVATATGNTNTTNTAAEASHMFAGAHDSDVISAAKASHVAAAAKTTAHMAAATEAAAVTATTTTTVSVGRAGQQARSEKSCRQYREHPFHRASPFQSDCSAPSCANFNGLRALNVG